MIDVGGSEAVVYMIGLAIVCLTGITAILCLGLFCYRLVLQQLEEAVRSHVGASTYVRKASRAL